MPARGDDLNTVVLPADPVGQVDRTTGAWERVCGAVAAGAAALLPVVIDPQSASQTFVPKYALLLILAAAGSVPLLRLAISSRYAWLARAALGFALVALVSALASPSKLIGIFGLYLWGTGAIFLYALMAAWALGVCLDGRGRTWLVRGLLVGAGANAVAAVVQVAFHLSTPTADLSGFGLYNGTQADGMLGNPVHLEALLLGALALMLGRTCQSRGRESIAPVMFVALLAAGLESSSERYAIVLLVAMAAYALWTYRAGALRFLGALAVGFGGASLGGAGTSLAQRVTTTHASSTFGLRIHAWETGIRATLEHRLLLGFGPGEARNALTLYEWRGFARAIPPGKYFADVHDLFVNIFVMTGALGALLFVTFLAGTSWRARGPLLGFAALSLAVELVEPLNIAVTPLAFLALGAALGASQGAPDFGRKVRAHQTSMRRSRLAVGALVLLPSLAAVPAGVAVVGDSIEHDATQPFSLDKARLADRLLPIWSISADVVAEIYAYESVVNRAARHRYLEESVAWARTAAARDPSDNEAWVLLSGADLTLGDIGAARTAALRAVTDDPLGADALSALGTAYAVAGEWQSAAATFKSALLSAPGDGNLTAKLIAAESHNGRFFR